MVKKRKRDGGDDSPAEKPKPASAATIGQQTSHIKNKQVRGELYAKLKHKKQKSKKVVRMKRQKAAELAEKQGLEPPPKQIPKTIENTREKDETVVDDNDTEVLAEEDEDEFAEHFQVLRPPKVLLTTCYKPSKVMYTFLSEMMEVLPSAEYYKRGGYPLKKIVTFASNREYTDLIVFNEDRKTINGMLHVHLPDGPSAMYKLSNLVLGRDIKNHGRATSHKAELILNNFSTRLGRRIGRMFGSLFSQQPNFKGRRVATFHNQRDFIFFRHHRYVFEEKEKRVKASKEGKQKVVQTRLQELGPRFTLKLLSLQKGTFNSKAGEFEWVHKTEMDTSRRRFHL